MKTIILTLLLVISAQVLNAQSFVGTWKSYTIENEVDTLLTTLTFNEDGTFTRYQEQSIPDLKNKPVTVLYQATGKWKLMSGGKRIFMKIKPSSVKVSPKDSGQGAMAGSGQGEVTGSAQGAKAGSTRGTMVGSPQDTMTGSAQGTIAKLAELSGKYDAFSSLYMPKIVSLTEDELVLLETVDDESGLDDEPAGYSVEVVFTRVTCEKN